MKVRIPVSTDDEGRPGPACDAVLVRRLAAFVRPYIGSVWLSFLIMLLLGAAQLAQPYIVKLAVDQCMMQRRVEGLPGLALWFLACLAAEFLLRFAQIYVLDRTGHTHMFVVERLVSGVASQKPRERC